MWADDVLKCSGEECWYARRGRQSTYFCTVYERDSNGDNIVLCDMCVQDPEYEEFADGRKCKKCKTVCLYDPDIHGNLCCRCFYDLYQEHGTLFAPYFYSNMDARISEYKNLYRSIDKAFYSEEYHESIAETIISAVDGINFNDRMKEIESNPKVKLGNFAGLIGEWKKFVYSLVQTTIDKIHENEPEIRKAKREKAIQSAISALSNPSSKKADDVLRAIINKMDNLDVCLLASAEDPIGDILNFLSRL